MFDIIVPTYRIKPAWLQKCLDSIQSQTVKKWTCYIIDGTPVDWPSYDALRLVIDSFVSLDSRFVYRRQTGVGVSQARNQGIDLGSNEFIAFLDGDDYWYPEHLIEFVRAVDDYTILEKCCSDRAVIYWSAADCPITLTFPKSQETHTTHRLANHIINYDSMSKTDQYHAILQSPLMTSQVVIVRERLDELEFQFDVKLCLGEDQDLWLRILDEKYDGVQILAVTGFHRVHDAQTTQHGDQLGGLDTDRDDRLAKSKELFRERHGYALSRY